MPMRTLLLFAGCASEDPAVQINTPEGGATVCGEPLVVDVVVENFTLVDMGGDAAAGEGHIDVTLNGQAITMGDEPPFDVFGMEDGVWRLTAELVDAAHQPLVPPVLDSVDITIDNATCTGDAP